MQEIFEFAERGVVVVVEAERGSLSVTGADAKSWLNGLVTCDVIAVDERRAGFGLLLSKQGKVQADLDLLSSPGGLLLGLPASELAEIERQLDRYLVMEDAELSPAEQVRWLRLLGPRAAAAVAAIARPLASGELNWLGGWTVAVSAPELAAALSAIDAVLGDAVLHATPDAWRALRVARSFPLFGVDYGRDDNPHEASLERRAVSWSKGCYLGQEVVCMQDMRGRVKRRLLPLAVESDLAVEVGSEVHAAGETAAVGRVTSAERINGRVFAFAMLKAPFFEGKVELSVLGRPARIVAPSTSA